MFYNLKYFFLLILGLSLVFPAQITNETTSTKRQIFAPASYEYSQDITNQTLKIIHYNVTDTKVINNLAVNIITSNDSLSIYANKIITIPQTNYVFTTKLLYQKLYIEQQSNLILKIVEYRSFVFYNNSVRQNTTDNILKITIQPKDITSKVSILGGKSLRETLYVSIQTPIKINLSEYSTSYLQSNLYKISNEYIPEYNLDNSTTIHQSLIIQNQTYNYLYGFNTTDLLAQKIKLTKDNNPIKVIYTLMNTSWKPVYINSFYRQITLTSPGFTIVSLLATIGVIFLKVKFHNGE